jgi:hypothetical protein
LVARAGGHRVVGVVPLAEQIHGVSPSSTRRQLVVTTGIQHQF